MDIVMAKSSAAPKDSPLEKIPNRQIQTFAQDAAIRLS
jgi:hypothetical protein